MLLKRIAEHKIIPLLGCKRLFDRSWYGNPLVENQGDHHFSPGSVIKKPNQLDHTYLLVWFSLDLDFWGTLELSLNFSIFIFHKLDHVSSDADIIHDRTKFRGSEDLVWLVITQWIGSPSVDYLVWFFDHIFSMIFGEKW